MKKICLLFFVLIGLFPGLSSAEEMGLEISPTIIDEKSQAGDILKYEINIVNKGERKMDIYAIVNDVSKTEGEVDYEDPSELDRQTSLARWISFKRGVIELLPGASTSIPLEINISSNAKPGSRFARIALPTGPNRAEAEGSMSSRSFVQLPINIDIEADIIENADVKAFRSLRNFYVAPPASFSFGFENIGNSPVRPLGSIFIYNRRGEELADLDANPEKDEVAAGASWEKALKWTDIKGMGKFKARLELEYGEKDKRDLQDTLYFWYFPWQVLLLIFISTFIILVITVALVFRRTFVHQQVEEAARLEVRQGRVKPTKIVNLKK